MHHFLIFGMMLCSRTCSMARLQLWGPRATLAPPLCSFSWKQARTRIPRTMYESGWMIILLVCISKPPGRTLVNQCKHWVFGNNWISFCRILRYAAVISTDKRAFVMWTLNLSLTKNRSISCAAHFLLLVHCCTASICIPVRLRLASQRLVGPRATAALQLLISS